MTPAEAAARLNAALAYGRADRVAAALGELARARGMTEIAAESGLTRESLYRALRADASPRFDTICRVAAALGVRLAAIPTTGSSRAARTGGGTKAAARARASGREVR